MKMTFLFVGNDERRELCQKTDENGKWKMERNEDRYIKIKIKNHNVIVIYLISPVTASGINNWGGGENRKRHLS